LESKWLVNAIDNQFAARICLPTLSITRVFDSEFLKKFDCSGSLRQFLQRNQRQYLCHSMYFHAVKKNVCIFFFDELQLSFKQFKYP